jgi:hypothetical protein
MALIESQKAAMGLLVSYLQDTKAYIDDVSQPTPSFEEYLDQIDTVDFETYLYASMSYTPSFIESAVHEVNNLVFAYRRDFLIRQMSRLDYFEDASLSLENDIKYLAGLKELQTQYLKGTTPQQRR